MKKSLFLLLFFPLLVFGQYKTETHQSNGYSYETVTNDPLNARIYTLSNGLKVYMTVYKDAPRIQTYVAVRAGSKNDPSDATGLAHYLEHILFKGTSKIGTSNWEKEKPQLDKIEQLYEVYRKTKNPLERQKLYTQIDSISLLAATYAIANEYDKLLSNLGATGTNAYTFVEQTVYVNDIPSNSIEKWAEIEAERFGEVVPRLFHTELEAVYEEKNKGMDTDRRKVWEALLENLFRNHQYGTQTTIGTIEHLKNPSITEIKKYFNKYYVANNMAICLSGDFDPDKTIQIIDRYFGKLKKQDVPEYNAPVETDITSPREVKIVGPDAENLTMAFRFQGKKEGKEKDPLYLKLIGQILTNGQAGLMDLNLNQKQKVMGAYAYDMAFNDYSMLVMGGKPKQGQTLEQLKDLLLGQLELVKKGHFDDWLLTAVINDIKISKMRSYESNKARADAFVDAFISHTPWEEEVKEIDQLSAITKQELVDFANRYFSNNYVAVFKETGVDSTVQKVPKPKISAVPVNRDNSSEFYKQVMAKPTTPLTPVFLDFNRDLDKGVLKNKLPVLYKKNTENGIFSLNYTWEIGSDTDPMYGVAISYMNYLGTDKLTNEELKKEFYKIGCSYSFSITTDAIYFNVTGLDENFEKAVSLAESILTNVKPDQEALDILVERIIKSRKDNKLNKDAIRNALVSYAKFGKESPSTNILSESQLKILKASELTDLIKGLKNIEHRVMYYGPAEKSGLDKKISTIHTLKGKLKKAPAKKKFVHLETNENKVYWADYNMVQAEIMFVTKCVTYDKSLAPQVTLFNEYFGGSMGSVVFQEMRESKALAYAVRSRYETASRKDDPNYIMSYIGTQADKIEDAMDGMNDLLNNMPVSEAAYHNAKTAIMENINTQRITKSGVLMEYERLRRLGIDYDIRKDIYNQLKDMSLNDIKSFHSQKIKNRNKTIVIVGSKDRINFEELSKYGKVQQLSLEEIFGY
ncbi:MAG: M16 family metallopeptidase [Cytophagaceae bacterium]